MTSAAPALPSGQSPRTETPRSPRRHKGTMFALRRRVVNDGGARGMNVRNVRRCARRQNAFQGPGRPQPADSRRLEVTA